MAEEKDVTDSQLFDLARQFEQEVKFKLNAAIGLRQYVKIKQDLKSKAQGLSDLEKAIAIKKKELESIILAANQRVQSLDADFNAKTAQKERELEDFGAKIGKELDQLKQAAQAQKAANERMAQESETTMKAVSAEHAKKMRAFKAQEEEKVAKIAALDGQYKELQASIDALKAKHGLQ